MQKWLRKKQPYLLMAPTMIWLLAFIIYPMIFSIVMALKQFKLKRGMSFWDMPWVGLTISTRPFTTKTSSTQCGSPF